MTMREALCAFCIVYGVAVLLSPILAVTAVYIALRSHQTPGLISTADLPRGYWQPPLVVPRDNRFVYTMQNNGALK